jgi:hypothetical protein
MAKTILSKAIIGGSWQRIARRFALYQLLTIENIALFKRWRHKDAELRGRVMPCFDQIRRGLRVTSL